MPVIALADVVAILVALMALLLILGGPAIIRFIQATVGRLPLVGGHISGYLTAAVDVATSAFRSWADSTIQPISHALWYTVVRPWRLVESMAGAIGQAVSAAARLAHRLSATASQLVHSIQHQYNVIEGDIHTAIWATLGIINTVEGDLVHEIQHQYNVITGEWKGGVADLTHGLDAAVSVLEGSIANLDHVTVQRIGAALGTAEDYVDSQVGGLARILGQDVGQLSGQLDYVAGLIVPVASGIAASAASAAVDGLDQAAHDLVIGPWAALIPALVPVIESLPQDVAQAIPGLNDLTGLAPLTVPGILAGAIPAIAALATEVGECGVPMCKNLGGLSNLFGSLLQDAWLVALFAAVADAALEPEQAATAVDDTLGPAVTGITNGIMDLIGAL